MPALFSRSRNILMLLCIVLPARLALAQQTAVYFDREAVYKNALDLFGKQKYGAAQKEFELALAADGLPEQVRDNCAFYRAWCSALLFHRDAESLLTTYLEEHPVSPNRSQAILELARYFYQQKQYKKSIAWFEQADLSHADDETTCEVCFKLGYADYRTNDYDGATHAFARILDKDSKYTSAATYYYAHIAYLNGDYDTALKYFLRLKDSEAFAPVAPYYITQIYYRQKKFDEVLKYAPSKLDTGAVRNGLEMERMVAEAYYQKDDYKAALPYLSDYEKNSGAATRLDRYQLAYCYYMSGDYPAALPLFQQLTTGDDSLAQHAYFHLAGCYLATGNKRSARTAFQAAGRLDADPAVQEEALFYYAKLSYELNYQSVAIESFQSFLKQYPESRHAAEAQELIVDVYATTRNYRDALAAIDAIRNKSPRIVAAYQKAAYFRGVELMGNNQPAEAIQSFTRSAEQAPDARLEALAFYWSGDCQYKLGQYDLAVSAYSAFLHSPAAASLPQYNLAQYNLGYAWFKKEDYANAQAAFRKYTANKKETDPKRYNDATLRIADAAYMQHQPAAALEQYDLAIRNKAEAGDYALYQKGLILGIMGKMAEKIATLKQLFDAYPRSLYYDDALYEAATASLYLDKNEQALAYYKRITTDFSNGSYMKKALLGEAQVYYNMHQDDRALAAFKSVISRYPNTTEAQEALDLIRNIYVNQNKTDEFFAYVKTVPNADISKAAQDSLVYESAELRYTQGNCAKAVKDFTDYLDRFPEGIFAVNANYYRSDCLFRDKQYEAALPGYEFVIGQPRSPFTEKSLLCAGLIQYSLKAYDKAVTHFAELQQVAEMKENVLAAVTGQMRCRFMLKDYGKTLEAAAAVIGSPNADKELVNEAHLLAGKSALELGDLRKAKDELSVVARRTNSEMTAEAKYYLAVVEYRLGNFKDSQKIIFDIAKQEPGYDYWIARGFILLGDDYLALKDTFQARETWKSIVANYQRTPGDPDDLRALATEKLEAVWPAAPPPSPAIRPDSIPAPEEEKNR